MGDALSHELYAGHTQLDLHVSSGLSRLYEILSPLRGMLIGCFEIATCYVAALVHPPNETILDLLSFHTNQLYAILILLPVRPHST